MIVTTDCSPCFCAGLPAAIEGKSATWKVHRYWRTVKGDRWRFATAEGIQLANHASFTIRRHALVKGTASPYDGNLVYWARRLHQHPLTRSILGKLLAEQRGKCGYCGLYFLDEAIIEIDHIIPRRLGGDNQPSNLMALHRHCHAQRHAQMRDGGSHDNDPS